MPQPFISLEGVRKSYQSGGEELLALSDVTMKVAEGELVSIQGSSGSGKSTLLNLLGCLDKPTSGSERNLIPSR